MNLGPLSENGCFSEGFEVFGGRCTTGCTPEAPTNATGRRIEALAEVAVLLAGCSMTIDEKRAAMQHAERLMFSQDEKPPSQETPIPPVRPRKASRTGDGGCPCVVLG
jgi:hypothetical protein